MATVALSAPAAFAADEYNTSVGMTAANAPLGLHGIDPVAFIKTGEPVEGSAAHTAEYLPQNGGFCTFGVSVGKKFDGDPAYHAVIDDKLYVFLNEEIFAAFNKDRAGTISKASKNWKEIHHTAVGDL